MFNEYSADWYYSEQIHDPSKESPVYTGVFSWWSLAEFCLNEMIDSGINVNWLEFKNEHTDDPEFNNMDYFCDTTLVYVGFIYDPESDIFDINPDAEFSAIVSNENGCPTVQVLQSKHYKHVRAFCSPCYPGQADADSGDGFICCYSLPPNMLDTEN